jgi:ribonucleoside-diphosphate reductase alpha chain
MKTYGPTLLASEQLHAEKYRSKGESFRECATRVANALSDSERHFQALREILLDMRFLPAGRIQSAAGSLRATTHYNCFVSGTIEDSFTEGAGSIMARAAEAAKTMRMGGGIGYDFSTLRPRGALIRKLDAASSGPLPFMEIFDAVGRATSSAGNRRGAQMGVLRVDHPDIEEFIRAKQNYGKLSGFNISVAITDEFMEAVKDGSPFNLTFEGHIYRQVDARALWEMIMRSTYDWADPGVLFIDTINERNNLYYCETLSATNPCGEQPLPPYGACLLGSFNLPSYLTRDRLSDRWEFDFAQFHLDIATVVRAMDNVVDRARYPLHEQEKEARSKRRMGLGVTGLANALEAMGYPYASDRFLQATNHILANLRNEAYRTSAVLAKEKGVFPLYDRDKFTSGKFIQSLPEDIQELIWENGSRNSHLLSIAPTGTISFCADNVSSGIEPVFATKVKRLVNTADGPELVELEDYGVRVLGTKNPKTVDQCSVDDHLKVLICASTYVDSAVSKTCNVSSDIEWEAFKNIYFRAWAGNCKGCTTYRVGGKREAIIEAADAIEDLSCKIDPETGERSCE